MYIKKLLLTCPRDTRVPTGGLWEVQVTESSTSRWGEERERLCGTTPSLQSSMGIIP